MAVANKWLMGHCSFFDWKKSGAKLWWHWSHSTMVYFVWGKNCRPGNPG